MIKKAEKGVFETLEAQVVEEAGNFVKDKIKSKALRVGEISLLIILGFILISFGLANLLGSYYPILDTGFNYLIIGVVFLIVSFSLKV
ncbi:MAG: hypothetical protein PF569_04145 [Candidatus Woesearchaeota archaeon]|jgi:hypothetical protein|nr:hypothetical protein [Candidatus Woesearchaeota archaeon]